MNLTSKLLQVTCTLVYVYLPCSLVFCYVLLTVRPGVTLGK